MSLQKTPKVALVIIGNEILSGRTLDKNTHHIAGQLTERGLALAEVRIVPDKLDKVVAALNEVRAEYDYVFTTGGLGPTHDDITVDCIAAAFDVDVIVHSDAYARLEKHYGKDEFSEARQRMARTPDGAGLIDNPVSTAPGFVIGNVYAMAGVPRIMQAMLDNVLRGLEGGAVIESRTVSCSLPESEAAGVLTGLQARYEDIDIGSYPFFHNKNVGVSIVLRGTDIKLLDKVAQELTVELEKLGASPKYLH